MRAITIDSPGGPEVLVWGEVPDPVCGPGEVVVDVVATAVNRADLLQRQSRPVPAAQMVPSVPRPRQGGRDRPLGRLLPVIFVWIMIAAAAGSPSRRASAASPTGSASCPRRSARRSAPSRSGAGCTAGDR